MPGFVEGWLLRRHSGSPGNALLGSSSILDLFLLKIMAHTPEREFQPLNYGAALMWWLRFF